MGPCIRDGKRRLQRRVLCSVADFCICLYFILIFIFIFFVLLLHLLLFFHLPRLHHYVTVPIVSTAESRDMVFYTEHAHR